MKPIIYFFISKLKGNVLRWITCDFHLKLFKTTTFVIVCFVFYTFGKVKIEVQFKLFDLEGTYKNVILVKVICFKRGLQDPCRSPVEVEIPYHYFLQSVSFKCQLNYLGSRDLNNFLL